jgi:hypothetical protein
MKIAVQGTVNFNNYNVFLRAMSVAMSSASKDDNEFLIYSVGPATINGYVTGFCNITERSMKARGKKIKFQKVPLAWAEENITEIDYLIFLSNPGEYNSKLVAVADLNGVEVGTFRF